MATVSAKSGVKNGQSKAAKRRPVFSKRYWPVQVAVFEFENDGRLNHSIELTRTFRRDDESEWETTTYFTSQDLLPASKLLSEAYTVIQSRIEKARSESSSSESSEDVPF